MTNAPISSMTTTHHARRQRANSVPVGSRSIVMRNIENASAIPEVRVASSLNASNVHVSEGSRSTDTAQPPEQVVATAIPHWQRELAKSRVGRHSRASSIISTRTRLTVQSEDARSVEVEAGGQSFRISRDGSVITNTTAPPPYPGPPLRQVDEASDEEEPTTRDSIDTVREENTPFKTPINRSLQSLPIRTHVPPTTSDDEGTPEPTRKSSPFEFRRFRSVFNWYTGAPAETSYMPPRTNSTSKYLRRTQSDSSSLGHINPWDSASSQTDTDGYDTYESTDDDNARTVPGTSTSNPPKKLRRKHKHKHKPKQRDNQINLPVPTPAPVSTNANAATHPDIDTNTAELSAHYTHILRTLDRTHRTTLHARDEQLARLRELLNEKDIIYRQQLRDRDHTIDSLTSQLAQRDRMINEVKTRMYEVEEDVERRIEKARNEVEDMWERRWKEFEVVLRGGLSVVGYGHAEAEGEGDGTVTNESKARQSFLLSRSNSNSGSNSPSPRNIDQVLHFEVERHDDHHEGGDDRTDNDEDGNDADDDDDDDDDV